MVLLPAEPDEVRDTPHLRGHRSQVGGPVRDGEPEVWSVLLISLMLSEVPVSSRSFHSWDPSKQGSRSLPHFPSSPLQSGAPRVRPRGSLRVTLGPSPGRAPDSGHLTPTEGRVWRPLSPVCPGLLLVHRGYGYRRGPPLPRSPFSLRGEEGWKKHQINHKGSPRQGDP